MKKQKPTTANQQPPTDRPPITILTFTPVWQRREVFKICLKGIQRLVNYDPKRFKIIPFFVISESWAAQELIKLNYDFVFVENETLGAKKNAGLKYALENYRFDYLMEIGSDDLLRSDYLDLIEPYILNKTPQFCPSGVYFIDVRDSRTAFWETDKVLGAGRCIARVAIEKATVRETFWEKLGRRGMDTYSWRMLLKAGIQNTVIKTGHDVFALDIKSNINVNQISLFAPSPLKLAEILSHFPESDHINKLISDNK